MIFSIERNSKKNKDCYEESRLDVIFGNILKFIFKGYNQSISLP
jgi:hypothetical protein